MEAIDNKVTFINTKSSLPKPNAKRKKMNLALIATKAGLQAMQYVSAKMAAKVAWHFYTIPGKARFSEGQQALLDEATTHRSTYQNHSIVSYTWGHSHSAKVLLCHGWRSKTVDFRKMILGLLDAGFCVEGIDMKAHGLSQGKQTALPEFRDIIKAHLTNSEKYDVIVGDSLGALACSIAVSELPDEQKPQKLFLVAAPPFVRFFMKDFTKAFNFKGAVYDHMCDLVETYYGQPIDYFDLRDKKEKLKTVEKHLIYSEDDKMVPFSRGEELREAWQDASFAQAKGLSHFKIISDPSIVKYVVENSAEL